MQFSDKLNFLMNITHTSNKELAEHISVDRSLVSLLRNGKRGLPRNRERVQSMALFFAQRSAAEFQRHALAEMLGQAALRSSMPTEVLANYLCKWLEGDTDLVGHIIDGIESVPVSPPEPPEVAVPEQTEKETLFLYGEEGRREAMLQILQAIQRLDEPCSILITSDDNLEWLLPDYRFTTQVQATMLEAMHRGFTLHQIMPPMNFLTRYTESMRFWLPMYATGQVKVYYYPRLRGNLYRRSIIIVPGHCIRVSTSIGLGSANAISLFSTDPELVQAYTEQYREHLALCRPALTAHPDQEDFLPCLQDILSRQGDFIQTVSELPLVTMPSSLLERCIRESDHLVWKRTYQMYLDEIPNFEEKLRQSPHIDMAHLATAEEVRAGKVCMAIAYPTYPGHLRYTPETYVLHLQNILRLMEQYDHYCFLPLYEKDHMDYDLLVNEDGLALLVRNRSPMLMLELRRPELVQACREHLLRIAERVGYDGIQRERVRMEINTLIRELQS